MPSEERDELLLVAVGIVFVVWLLYSVLILQRLLAGVGLVLPLVVIYLLWRVVRATERIADALEDDGPGAGRSTEEDPSGDGPWTGDDAGTTD